MYQPNIASLGPGSVVYEPVVITARDANSIHIGSKSRIDAFVKIEGGFGVKIGDGVHIASFAHVNIGGGETIIEDGAAMASGAKTISGGNMPDALSCSASAPIDHQVVHRGKCVLKKNSILYTNAVMCPDTTLGEGARVLPGSVVISDVPDYEIWGGVPAKFIRKVDLGGAM